MHHKRFERNQYKHHIFSSENYCFYSHEKLQYFKWACFRNEDILQPKTEITKTHIGICLLSVPTPMKITVQNHENKNEKSRRKREYGQDCTISDS